MGFSPTTNPEFSATEYLFSYTYLASRFVFETDTATGSRSGDSRFEPKERQLAEGSSWGEVEGTR